MFIGRSRVYSVVSSGIGSLLSILRPLWLSACAILAKVKLLYRHFVPISWLLSTISGISNSLYCQFIVHDEAYNFLIWYIHGWWSNCQKVDRCTTPFDDSSQKVRMLGVNFRSLRTTITVVIKFTYHTKNQWPSCLFVAKIGRPKRREPSPLASIRHTEFTVKFLNFYHMWGKTFE